MYILKHLNKIVLASAVIFFAGCSMSYAPFNWLPAAEDVPTNPYGGWITLLVETADSIQVEYSGEFIAADTCNVFLLYDSLYIINKENISMSLIEIDEKNTGTYALWTTFGAVSTFLHGRFGMYTLPLWLVGGIPAVSGDSFRDRYEVSFPNNTYWYEVNKFSRFPQGLVGINISLLIPIYNITPGSNEYFHAKK